MPLSDIIEHENKVDPPNNPLYNELNDKIYWQSIRDLINKYNGSTEESWPHDKNVDKLGQKKLPPISDFSIFLDDKGDQESFKKIRKKIIDFFERLFKKFNKSNNFNDELLLDLLGDEGFHLINTGAKCFDKGGNTAEFNIPDIYSTTTIDNALYWVAHAIKFTGVDSKKIKKLKKTLYWSYLSSFVNPMKKIDKIINEEPNILNVDEISDKEFYRKLYHWNGKKKTINKFIEEILDCVENTEPLRVILRMLNNAHKKDPENWDIFNFIKKQNKYPDKIFPFNKNEKRKRKSVSEKDVEYDLFRALHFAYLLDMMTSKWKEDKFGNNKEKNKFTVSLIRRVYYNLFYLRFHEGGFCYINKDNQISQHQSLKSTIPPKNTKLNNVFTDKSTLPFEIMKFCSILGTLQGTYNIIYNNAKPESDKDIISALALITNVTEAVWQDSTRNYPTNITNAEAGKIVAISNGMSNHSGIKKLPNHYRNSLKNYNKVRERNGSAISPFIWSSNPRIWSDMYNIWNMSFVLNFEAPHYMISKLLIPSVSCYQRENINKDNINFDVPNNDVFHEATYFAGRVPSLMMVIIYISFNFGNKITNSYNINYRHLGLRNLVAQVSYDYSKSYYDAIKLGLENNNRLTCVDYNDLKCVKKTKEEYSKKYHDYWKYIFFKKEALYNNFYDQILKKKSNRSKFFLDFIKDLTKLKTYDVFFRSKISAMKGLNRGKKMLGDKISSPINIIIFFTFIVILIKYLT